MKNYRDSIDKYEQIMNTNYHDDKLKVDFNYFLENVLNAFIDFQSYVYKKNNRESIRGSGVKREHVQAYARLIVSSITKKIKSCIK